MSDQFKRKDPEEILQSIYNIKKGRLKIILGAVSRAGKTYHLLLEGNDLEKKGIDVVIGATDSYTRANPGEQLGCLEIIPPIQWEEEGEVKYDLNMDEILARNPEVVLVDGLAHHNRQSAKNPTRLDDVKELISHKISVISTINIYELEGVKDIAERLLKIPIHVNNPVPEDTLSLADEVRLLDVTPEAILKRLQEEEPEERNQGDLLFKKDNLAVLRELSLRFLAGEVGEDLTFNRESEGLSGPSGASERILVCVQYYWNGSILIRRGDQIAKRLGGDLIIASFINGQKTLSKEELAFKSSIQKLIKKLDGKFEEVKMIHEDVAEEIVAFALQHQITRIIIGQSKRTRWEEILYGSIVNKILRKTNYIDVFIVADRYETEGERVLPAKSSKRKRNPYQRLTHEEIQEKINKVKRGTLKIYIGAAPGVGKTFTMLREANELKKKQIDVVIGLLETHGRKETANQVGNLEIIPRIKVAYKNVKLEEMDLDGIIRRNPEVALIDELAHTNVPGSKNKKRYEDVVEILNAGISVISTMNIQHVESLNDSVEQITGVEVRETVPDRILRVADELELIDISPKALRQRMQEGHIYAMEKVEQSLNHFFKLRNLIALRELALRELADDVDDRLESVERKEGFRGPWRKEEVIFVCVNLRKDSERLIRRGFRIAYRLKARWHVIFVQDSKELTESEKAILGKIINLTNRLGGSFETCSVAARRKVVTEIIKHLSAKKATQVILGQSARTRWKEIKEGSIVARLLREVRHLDVLVVAD